MRILSAKDVRYALPMPDAIAAMRRAFAAVSAGRADMPLRAHIDVPGYRGIALVMPALVHDEGDAGQGAAGDVAMAVKVVSLFAGNPDRGLARIQAAVLAIDPTTGAAIALLEGATLTAIRTGAASGVATDLLARPDASVLAVFGAGVQARTQIRAVRAVRDIREVHVFDLARNRATDLAGELAARGDLPDGAHLAESPAAALARADVVCTTTTAAEPVFDDADLPPGVHVNAMGSYQPDVVEIPAATMGRARIVVDHHESALAETGDLIQPIEAGLLRAEDIHAEIGEIVLGRKAGRASDEQVTLFKSVGLAAQDAIAAQAALRNAAVMGLGQEVPW